MKIFSLIGKIMDNIMTKDPSIFLSCKDGEIRIECNDQRMIEDLILPLCNVIIGDEWLFATIIITDRINQIVLENNIGDRTFCSGELILEEAYEQGVDDIYMHFCQELAKIISLCH